MTWPVLLAGLAASGCAVLLALAAYVVSLWVEQRTLRERAKHWVAIGFADARRIRRKLGQARALSFRIRWNAMLAEFAEEMAAEQNEHTARAIDGLVRTVKPTTQRRDPPAIAGVVTTKPQPHHGTVTSGPTVIWDSDDDPTPVRQHEPGRTVLDMYAPKGPWNDEPQ